MEQKRMRLLTPYYFIFPCILILILVAIFPFVYSIFLSFHYYNLLKPTKNAFIGFKNYYSMLGDERLWNTIYVTIVFTGLTVFVELVLGLVLALFLNRDFIGKQVVRTLLLCPMVMPPVVVAIIWRMFYNADAGMFNYFLALFGLAKKEWLGLSSTALFAVAFTDIWEWTPFILLMCIAGLESIPLEPVEAAFVDGASPWQVFRYVKFPLLKPILTIALLIRITDSLRTFDLIYVMTSGGPGIATEVYNLYVYFMGFRYFRIGRASSLAIVLTIVIMAIVIVVFRKIFVPMMGMKNE